MVTTRQLYDAIASTVANFEEMAAKAIKIGDGNLYVPGYVSLQTFVRLLPDPRLKQTGENNGEPAYLSLGEGLRGQNADGSSHNGFFILNVTTHSVTGVVDPQGNYSVGPNVDIQSGRWSGHRIDVSDSKGEKFVLRTKAGIRGTGLVLVIFQGEDIIVFDQGYVVEASKITEAAS